jgi:PAS domain S-box-containing protein
MVSERAHAVEGVRRALADATPTMSFHVTTVSAMADFWTRIADDPTDIAILDVHPSKDRGASVLQALRAQGITVPTILLGENEAGVPQEAATSEAEVEYLDLDTLSPRHLVTAIRHAIELNRSRSTQRSVEDALRRAQSQLREIVSHAGIFLCTHDLAGKILSIDEQSSRALGYGPRELVGAALPDLLAPKHRGEFSEYLRKVVRDRTATGFMAIQTKQGETRYWNYQNRLSDDPAPIVHGTAVDVTDRIRAEAASALAAQRQTAILDALPAHIALLGHDGTILAVNAAWKRFARENGVEESSVSEGVDYLAACERGVDAERAVEVAAGIRDVLSGKRDSYETEYPCDAPGKPRWFRLVVSPVLSEIRGAVVMHLDRTEQREAELESRRQAMIFENMHDAVVIADTEGNIRDWNPSAAAMHGLTRERSLGRPVAGLSESAGGARVMDEVRQRAKEEGRWSGDLDFVRPDGSPGLRELLVVPLRDATGLLLGTAGISRDITRRRLDEVALREAKEYSESLIRTANVIAVGLDTEGNVEFFNETAQRLTGYSAEELIGRSWFETVVPRDRYPLVWEAFRAGRAREAIPVAFDNPILTRSGEERMISWTNSDIYRHGRRSGTISFGVDLTERKRAESALAASEERYRNLFESNLAGIYRTSLEGRIIDFNDAFARVFGYSREELGEMNAGKLYFSEDDRRTTLDHLSRKNVLEGFECRLRRKDGSPVWVIENLAIVERPDGKFIEGSLLDISDRRSVEDALRESEARYRFLFENNPLPMWVFELETFRFLEVNAAAIRHYGYSRDEFLAMTLLDIRPAGDREKLLARVAHEAREPQPFELWSHRRKDGEILHVETSAVDLPGPERRRMVLVRDVTEKIAAEHAVRESEEKYRKIVDLSPIGIFQSTIEGNLLAGNDALARIFGYATYDELKNLGSLSRLHGGPEQRRMSFVSRLTPGRTETMELPLHRKDGSPVRVEVTARLAEDEGGENRRIEGFVTDITDRKRIDEQRAALQSAIVATAQEWRDTFDAIETPVLVLDSKGIVRRLNRAAVRLAGRPFPELIGIPLEAIGPAEPWRTAAELLRASQEKTSASEVLCRDPRADLTWELSVTRIAGASREGSLSILVARDITMLVELQKSVMHSQSMAAMGSLVAGVAHEVRNPLFAISATLDAFELRFREQQEYKRYAGALRAQAERMTHLMHDLLDFAKPAVFDIHDVPVGPILAEAVRICGASAAAKGVALEIDAPDATAVARADQGRTTQVFVNLVENAIQHSPSGSTVRIGATRRNRGIVSHVEDQGSGIDPQDLPRLFEPFFTRRPGGTGLGLAIVHRIVTEQGGTVVLENRPGGGVRVEVALPSPDSDLGPDRAERKS